MNAADAEQLQVAEEKLLDMKAEKTKAKKRLKSVKQENGRIKDLKRKRVGELCGKLKDWEASSVVAAALGVEMEAAMGNVTKKHGTPYTDEFEAHARRLLATGVSADHC